VAELSNGHSIIVDTRLTSFNTKIHKANQLMETSRKRGNHPGPTTFYFEANKGHLFTKEKTGKYNFSNLEDDQK
jgi:competence protein ComK